MSKSKIIHIVAIQRETFGLGKDGGMAWHLPEDLKHFKNTTKNHIVVMGRKTFESLPNGALPNRINIVVTRNQIYRASGAEVFNDVKTAIDYASAVGNSQGKNVYIIGGAEIYKATAQMVDEKIITLVNNDIECDTFLDKTYLDDIATYLSCVPLSNDGIIYHVTCTPKEEEIVELSGWWPI